MSLIVLIEDVTPPSLPPTPEPKRFIKRETTIIDDLRQLFSEEDSKDVVFNINSQKLRAHRLILETRSPVFKRMFSVEMKERLSHEVTIDDVSFDGFSAFLEFIYTDNCKQFEPVEELLYLGDKYEVKELKVKAANLLLKKMDVVNVLNTLVLFDRFQLRDMKKEAIKFIFKKKNQVYGAAEKAEFEKSYPYLAELIEVSCEVGNMKK